MRETIGSTWIFYLVIIFVLIFASYLALTLNYSKAFRVKNEILTIIEKNEGFNDNAYKTINNYLGANNYQEYGYCPSGWKGVKRLDGTYESLEDVEDGTKYAYCLKKIIGYHASMPQRAYYKIRLFFKFDLPIMGQISTFDVDGQTYEMDHTYDGIS